MSPADWPVAASLLAAVGSGLLARHLWRYRGKPGANWFVASLACQTCWSLAYGVALLTFDPLVRWGLELLVWVAMTGTCFYFLAFALAYTGRAGLLDRFRRGVAAVPLVTAVVVATNPVHGLSWTGFELAPVGGLATGTGMAMLHGSPSRPEMILSQDETAQASREGLAVGDLDVRDDMEAALSDVVSELRAVRSTIEREMDVDVTVEDSSRYDPI